MQSSGAGYLTFAPYGKRTVVQRMQAHSPLKLLNPRNKGSGAWVFASNYGGGLVGGDEIALSVDLESGTKALLATQASTKIYRSEQQTTQRLNAKVASDGLLIVAPDPVVCFAGSNYFQSQAIDLDSGASLVYLDWFSAGRRASGERWAFDRYSSQLKITYDKKLIVNDALLLDQAHGSLAERMGRMNACAVLVIMGASLETVSAALTEAVKETPLQRRAALLTSLSPLPNNGIILRMAGVDLEQIGHGLRTYLKFVCPLLGDDPWARKW